MKTNQENEIGVQDSQLGENLDQMLMYLVDLDGLEKDLTAATSPIPGGQKHQTNTSSTSSNADKSPPVLVSSPSHSLDEQKSLQPLENLNIASNTLQIQPQDQQQDMKQLQEILLQQQQRQNQEQQMVVDQRQQQMQTNMMLQHLAYQHQRHQQQMQQQIMQNQMMYRMGTPTTPFHPQPHFMVPNHSQFSMTPEMAMEQQLIMMQRYQMQQQQQQNPYMAAQMGYTMPHAPSNFMFNYPSMHRDILPKPS
jgi:hypothetical protein